MTTASRSQGWLALCLCTPLALLGCTQTVSSTGHSFTTNVAKTDGTVVTVPGTVGWVDTGLEVIDGEPLSITASGRVVVRQSDRWGQKFEATVSPEGTFMVHDGIQDQRFPLPSGSQGPAPCFCLMGRIGENGKPFFVGKSKSWQAANSGRLQLAVNDFDPSDSEGAFHAEVSRPKLVQPMSYEEVVPANSTSGTPLPNCQVVIFYADGLRPDVVREMATMGHLPNIQSLFLENGCWMSNCYTTFPSDTITANGTMWTGCFSDRHGLKGQVRFSRQRLVSQSYLDPLGPSRSARLLSPQGLDRALVDGQSTARKWIYGGKEGHAWKHSLTSDIAPLYELLRSEGRDWATGTLPVMTESPPPLWSRSLARTVPYLKAQDAWKYLDDANANYAVRQLMPREQPVMIVWLPETDSVSHKECRGQFGATRRTIAQADQLIGQVVAEFKAQNRLRSTYFCLVSDHGHHGGRTGHLSLFDIAHELFYRPRELDAEGRWTGGGLGLTVRQHRERAHHDGDGGREFVFIDGDSDGVARVYLPKGQYRSGDWSGPNRPADLLAYRIADHLPPINLTEFIAHAEFNNPGGQQQERGRDEPARLFDESANRQRTIDLVLMKLGENSVLVTTADRGSAVIERQPLERTTTDTIRWQLRYSVVTDVQPTADGQVSYNVVEHPLRDPLGLTQVVDASFLREWHNEREWLETQNPTQYPDSVVTLSRHVLWQSNIAPQEADAAPDLVITARPGWYFGNQSSPGTMHGYPLPDSMRACMFVAGPNIRRGARIDSPCRLADLTPTLLDMVGSGIRMDHFDGQPIRAIYQPDVLHLPTPMFSQHIQKSPFPIQLASADDANGLSSKITARSPAGDITLTSGQVMRAVFWDSVDLKAWQPVSYQPVSEYPDQPLTINHPTSPYDLNNVAYNALLFTELGVFRVMDDVISPLTRGRHPFMTATDRVDLALRHHRSEWVSESANVIDLTNATIWDYQITSQTNLRRVNAAVDYVQRREQDLEENVANVTGQSQLPTSKLLHRSVDATQLGFWNLYGFGQRTLVQLLDETLIQGIENSTDRTLNAARPMPAEIRAARK
ncbi:MAG: alkaline phosphatase family protein [Planctomycetaceae bacterium]|nr:alkaline phosphatase family protein [Planctomycetaceae bacterium]